MAPTSLINNMKFKVKFIKDGHPVMALEGIWDDGMDEGEDKTAVAVVNVSDMVQSVGGTLCNTSKT